MIANHEYEPFIVRVAWEGTLLASTSHAHRDDADDDFDARVKFYLNAPDVSAAVGTCIQLIHEEDVCREFVA